MNNTATTNQPTLPQHILAKIASQNESQVAINGIYEMTTDAQLNEGKNLNEWVADVIAGVADLAHAEYPQYDGFWNDRSEWAIYRITEDVTTKFGMAFQQQDIVIASVVQEPGFITAYSVRNAVNTVIKSRMVVKL